MKPEKLSDYCPERDYDGFVVDGVLVPPPPPPPWHEIQPRKGHGGYFLQKPI